MSIGALQIAIVLASISIVTRIRALTVVPAVLGISAALLVGVVATSCHLGRSLESANQAFAPGATRAGPNPQLNDSYSVGGGTRDGSQLKRENLVVSGHCP